jgi:hypothetical protein
MANVRDHFLGTEEGILEEKRVARAVIELGLVAKILEFGLVVVKVEKVLELGIVTVLELQAWYTDQDSGTWTSGKGSEAVGNDGW